MLASRLVTGLTLVAVFVTAIVIDERLAPWYPFWFLVSSLAMGASALEVVGLLDRSSTRPSGNTVFGGVMALVVANWAPHLVDALSYSPILGDPPPYDPSAPVDVLAWPLWTFAAIVMFSFVAQSVQFTVPGKTMATISGTILAVAYVGLLGSFVVQFRWLGDRYHGLISLAALVATAKGADTGAYTMGRIAGRHKLWPRLSPNKTIEGALGGLAFGTLGASVVIAIARYGFSITTLSWPATIGFGLLVGAAAQLGDLMESMIKRDCARRTPPTPCRGSEACST